MIMGNAAQGNHDWDRNMDRCDDESSQKMIPANVSMIWIRCLKYAEKYG